MISFADIPALARRFAMRLWRLVRRRAVCSHLQPILVHYGKEATGILQKGSTTILQSAGFSKKGIQSLTKAPLTFSDYWEKGDQWGDWHILVVTCPVCGVSIAAQFEEDPDGSEQGSGKGS